MALQSDKWLCYATWVFHRPFFRLFSGTGSSKIPPLNCLLTPLVNIPRICDSYNPIMFCFFGSFGTTVPS